LGKQIRKNRYGSPVHAELVEARAFFLMTSMSFWVYNLRCANGSYYTGHTDNLEKRVAEHQMGKLPGYTLSRRPVALVYSEAFTTREEVLACERRIKGWSRKKKEAMMRGDWAEVARLAKGGRPVR
jgi:putative endonuclease